MRIAHIVSTYPPYYAGMGNVVFQSAEELSKLGHEVVVFTTQYYKTEEIRRLGAPEIKKYSPELEKQIHKVKRLVPSAKYGNAARLPQLKTELDDFDLVHLHYPFFGSAGLVRDWKEKNKDKLLVITYHMDNRASGWKGLVFSLYAKFWMPKILGSADKIIGSSFDYIESSDARFLFERDRRKWVELPFGVDVERFSPREKPLSFFEKLKLNPDLPLLLFVGGMDIAHYFKGVKKLIDALLILKKNGVEAQTIFVGDGNLRPDFEQRAASFGLENFTRFVGRVSDEDLPGYYNMADLLILPSLNQGEAFGMVLLEAMASGVPVIASDLPGVRSVAVDGGIVVPPGNSEELAKAMVGYFSKENDREIWRGKAREIAEQKYSWEIIAKRLDGVYRELVGK